MTQRFATSAPCWLDPATKDWTSDWRLRPIGTAGEDRWVSRAMEDWHDLAAEPEADGAGTIWVGRADDLGGVGSEVARGGEVVPSSALADLVRAELTVADLGNEGVVVARVGREIGVVGTGAGVLYGVLRVLVGGVGLVADGQAIASVPDVALRMIDHWDNMVADPVLGCVERGYAGDSVFFTDGGSLVSDLARVEDYALLLSSVGINAVCLNNVNVGPIEMTLLTERLPLLRTLAEIFHRHHVATYCSVGFSAPQDIGGLTTCDPLDNEVAAWWGRTVDAVYRAIPFFGGLVVKADSEGRPGPFTYGRSHAEGANMLARALAPHNGTLMWRCFVYDCRQDWRDRTTDRARAASDHFMPLDGQFDDNVLLQVKHGPIDFQVREPVSPLLFGLKRTRIALELQIAHEYTGHAIDTCFLPSMWADVLATSDGGDPGATIAQRLERDGERSAVVGVSNIGDDWTWTGHPFSQANLYGFGRLSWDCDASAREIAAEWVRATFADETVQEAVIEILLTSYEAYENYTSPLGVGFMVTPGLHYGPNIDGYEYSRWGTYHFADRDGVGVDRTPAGSGYTEQYPEALAREYADPAICPERMLLFFHHVRYDQVLAQSGVTLIQRIYDTHFEGVEQVRHMHALWDGVREKVEDARVRDEVDRRFALQEDDAHEWCDQICTYFLRHSGIPDERGREIYA